MALRINGYHKGHGTPPYYIAQVRSWQVIIHLLQNEEYKRVQVFKHLNKDFTAEVILWL